MSNQQPPGSNPPGLPPTTYAAPGDSYTDQGSGDMLSTAYPLYPASQPEDFYRTGSVGGAGGQSLPSMRTFDPLPQHRAAPHTEGQSMPYAATHSMVHGAAHQMHLPPEGFPPYYAPPMGINPPYGVSSDPVVGRYTMPADARYIGHRQGPKKEIKRRTKTGCLTCRKRRIKCDEALPTCNNCKKSKRDCLGYDPMFRQATSPNQPSPSPQSTQGSSSTAPQGLSPSPSSSGPTALHIPYGASSAALPSVYPPTTRQTPTSATSQLSHDSQFAAQLPPGSLRGQASYDYYATPDQAFRSPGLSSLADETYPAGPRHSTEDSYQYRGGPPST